MKNHDKICVDANVLLEVLLEGRKRSHIAATVLGRASKIALTPLSYHLYVHFGKKEGHSVEELIADLADFEVLAMNDDTINWANLNYANEDFEDALQIGCAMSSDCDTFVTFDQQLAKSYQDSPFLKITCL